MKCRRVWFVSHYSMPPEYEMRIKTQMYAKYLGEYGIETRIFSASTIHGTDINLISDNQRYIEKEYDGLSFVHIKCDIYRSNGYKRIRNMYQFTSGFVKVAKKYEQPDVIIADVNCINYGAISRYCKKNKIKLIIDVRDLWPLSIVEYLGISEKNPVIKYLYYRERKMYECADRIIFSMEGGREYIKDKKWDIESGGTVELNKVFSINNGIDVMGFQENITRYVTDDPDLENERHFKIVYVGSIRKVNGLERIVDTARLLADKQEIQFLIYGDGDEKQKLEYKCKEYGLKNIVFKGKIPKCYIPGVLTKCDVNLVHVTATPVMKYGCSLNKLFDYFASGKPIVSDLPVEYDLIKKYKAGVVVDHQSPNSLAKAILTVYQLPKEQYLQMCRNCQKAAQDYDYKKLTLILLQIIEEKDEYYYIS